MSVAREFAVMVVPAVVILPFEAIELFELKNWMLPVEPLFSVRVFVPVAEIKGLVP